MSDWDKIISFSNSKQGGAIQFILVCIILFIMFGSYFRNHHGGKQRDYKQSGGSALSWITIIVILIILIGCLYVTYDVLIYKK